PCGHTYTRIGRDSAASGRSRPTGQARGRPRIGAAAARRLPRRAASAATGPGKRPGTLSVADGKCLRATLRSSWRSFALIVNVPFTKDQAPRHMKRGDEQPSTLLSGDAHAAGYSATS